MRKLAALILSAAVLLLAATAQAEVAPLGDIPGWHQIFRDGFATSVPVGGYPSNQVCGGTVYPASKWCPYPDDWLDTSHNGTYLPSQGLSNHDGYMDIHLFTLADSRIVVDAPQPILPNPVGDSGGRLYGRYAARLRADALHCYKTAWLLWPDSDVPPWPANGEIDFPEGDLDSTISGFMHRQGATSGSDQYGIDTSARYGAWHKIVLIWKLNLVQFKLDGVTVGSTTYRVPNTPMHWVLQTETGLGGCVPSPFANGHLLVDWAVAYAPV